MSPTEAISFLSPLAADRLEDQPRTPGRILRFPPKRTATVVEVATLSDDSRTVPVPPLALKILFRTIKRFAELKAVANDVVSLNVMRRRFEQWDRDDAESRFRRLAELWHRETDHLSVTSRVLSHPAYKEILTFAHQVLPLIFEDLETRDGCWFEALEWLTEQNPALNVRSHKEAVDAWLRWALDYGYIRDREGPARD